MIIGQQRGLYSLSINQTIAGPHNSRLNSGGNLNIPGGEVIYIPTIGDIRLNPTYHLFRIKNNSAMLECCVTEEINPHAWTAFAQIILDGKIDEYKWKLNESGSRVGVYETVDAMVNENPLMDYKITSLVNQRVLEQEKPEFIRLLTAGYLLRSLFIKGVDSLPAPKDKSDQYPLIEEILFTFSLTGKHPHKFGDAVQEYCTRHELEQFLGRFNEKLGISGKPNTFY